MADETTRERPVHRADIVIVGAGAVGATAALEAHAAGASFVALDVHTGKLKWYYQMVHHDIWDYDGPEPTMLFTWVGPNGQQVPAIGHANKAGYYFILDRRTGKPLIPVTEKPVPTEPSWQNAWPTQPFPATDPLVPHTIYPWDVPAGMVAAPEPYTPPIEQPIVLNPGAGGGPQWPPVAYSPRTHFVYLAGIGGYAPEALIGNPNHPENGWGSAYAGDPRWGAHSYGLVDALDTTTGKLAWQRQITYKSLSGAAVAGDLVFFGQDTGEFDAVDAKTGALLWSWGNPDHEPNVGGANGSPAVYMVNGREYVVMPFGGNSGLWTAYGTAHVGDAVIAFALPQGTAGTGNGADPAPAAATTAKPHVVHGPIPDVPDFGHFPGKFVPPAARPPAGSTVYTIQFRSLLYYPKKVTVAPGQLVAIHLMDTDPWASAAFAIDLPTGSVAMRSQLAAGHDAYIAFQVPNTPGTYTFYYPSYGMLYQGAAGTLTVAGPGQATSPSIPAAQAPTANVGPVKAPSFGGE